MLKGKDVKRAESRTQATPGAWVSRTARGALCGEQLRAGRWERLEFQVHVCALPFAVGSHGRSLRGDLGRVHGGFQR